MSKILRVFIIALTALAVVGCKKETDTPPAAPQAAAVAAPETDADIETKIQTFPIFTDYKMPAWDLSNLSQPQLAAKQAERGMWLRSKFGKKITLDVLFVRVDKWPSGDPLLVFQAMPSRITVMAGSTWGDVSSQGWGQVKLGTIFQMSGTVNRIATTDGLGSIEVGSWEAPGDFQPSGKPWLGDHKTIMLVYLDRDAGVTYTRK